MARGRGTAYLFGMKPMLPLLGAALLLAGCTPMAFQKPGVTEAQALTDSAECRALADREAMRAPWWPWSPHGFGHGFRRHVFDPFGPRYHSGLSIERMRAERDLADFCMRARGYELQPVPDPPP